ncbi:MAG: aquaporin [Planctomycetes bacterium]|nr:aquaporin [Planctomycetota bacterium]
MRALLGEAIGTFALVLLGTGAIVADAASGGAIGHVGVSLVFGLAVLAIVNAIGDVSGAHVNPAVTVAFAAAGRFPWARVPAYAAAQVAGAVTASLVLRVLFPADVALGGTSPAGGAQQAFLVELLLTWFLMLVILSVSDGARERGIVAGLTIGGVVALGALFAGPVSGGSLNPARSLGPALVTGRLEGSWVYLAAPTLGALLAVPGCRLLRTRGCCPASRTCP